MGKQIVAVGQTEIPHVKRLFCGIDVGAEPGSCCNGVGPSVHPTRVHQHNYRAQSATHLAEKDEGPGAGVAGGHRHLLNGLGLGSGCDRVYRGSGAEPEKGSRLCADTSAVENRFSRCSSAGRVQSAHALCSLAKAQPKRPRPARPQPASGSAGGRSKGERPIACMPPKDR